MGNTTKSTFQLDLTFFGLTYDIAPEARNSLFRQIHQIVFHGNGGYDWHTIYNMPIWLRKFTFNEIQNHYDEEKKQMKNSNNKGSKTVIGADGKVKAPEFLKNPQPNRKPVKYK
jgi:hypothetical protein